MTGSGLFEPDVLISEVYGGRARRGAALSSEKRLMLAVLRNALTDYQKYMVATDRVGRELFTAAAKWLVCTRNEHWFSFENITETLEIDAQYLRSGLAMWHQRLLEAKRAVETDPQVAAVDCRPRM